MNIFFAFLVFASVTHGRTVLYDTQLLDAQTVQLRHLEANDNMPSIDDSKLSEMAKLKESDIRAINTTSSERLSDSSSDPAIDEFDDIKNYLLMMDFMEDPEMRQLMMRMMPMMGFGMRMSPWRMRRGMMFRRLEETSSLLDTIDHAIAMVNDCGVSGLSIAERVFDAQVDRKEDLISLGSTNAVLRGASCVDASAIRCDELASGRPSEPCKSESTRLCHLINC